MSKSEKKYLNYPIYFWAFCDTLVVVAFIIGWLTNGEIPVLTNINHIIQSFSEPLVSLSLLTATLFFLIETSIYFSAYFFIRQNKLAAYIVYFQTPLRLFMGYSTIPMVTKLIADSGNFYFSVFLPLEFLKLFSVFYWHIYSLNKESFKDALYRYYNFLLQTNTIVSIFLISTLITTSVEIIFFSENQTAVFVNIASLSINGVLALFVVKRNTIALSIFCVSLFVFKSVNLIWLLSNLEEFSFYLFLAMLLDLYFISAAVVITKRNRQKMLNIVKI